MSISAFVYDIEQFQNYHCGVFYDVNTNETITFQIDLFRNENKVSTEILKYHYFLNEGHRFCGFNILGYDNHIIEIIKNANDPDDLIPKKILKKLQEKNDEMFSEEYRNKKYKPKNTCVHSLDLFRIHHFNNMAKACSLKWVQFAVNWANLKDFDNFERAIEEEEVSKVLEYCTNDVLSTYEFYVKSKSMIALRKNLANQYSDIEILNYDDVKIGEYILGKEYCRRTGMRYEDLKGMKTKRDSINLGEILFDYIEFENESFNNILKFFKSKEITSTKDVFKNISVLHGGVKYDFGLGGLHGSVKNKIFEADDEHELLDIDVKSFYPNLSIKNKVFPEHLGEIFCDVYEGLFDLRLQAQSKHDWVLDAAYKLALNGSYGKSNSEYSFLYDPKFTMTITVNGQLLLCMLIEQLSKHSNVIQANTDGVTVHVKKENKEKILELCKAWEEKTQLTLEYENYSKFVVSSVNDYVAITPEGKIKQKGDFDSEKKMKNQIQYHKNHSMKVVPKSLIDFFIKGIPVEESIKNNKNIFDFCIGVKSKKSEKKGRSTFVLRRIAGSNYEEEELQKTNRFIVSNQGDVIKKKYEDNTESEVIKHPKKGKAYKVKVVNDLTNIKPIEEYNIDYSYYIREANKIVYNIIPLNHSLF
jgi:hypothetical protein